MNHQIAEIVRLRAQVEELTAERDYLREKFGAPDDQFIQLGLTKTQRWIMGKLYAAAPALVHLESLYSCVGVRFGVDTVQDPRNTLAVHVNRIRKKLAPLGVDVRMLYGEGYSIDAAGKKRLAKIIEGGE